MKVSVLLFAQIAELFNRHELSVNDVQDVEALVAKLVQQEAGLINHTYAIAVNQKITKENISLSDNDVVALLPPFAGG